MHTLENMKISKKEIIIECSIQLFNQYGFKKVTVEEICDTSNSSKGTFYKHFSNKIDLIIHIVSAFVNEGNERFKNLMKEEIGFEMLVKEVLYLKQDIMGKYTIHFLTDLYESDTLEVQEILNKLHEDSINNSLMMYELGIKQGKINSHVTSDFFLYQLEILDKTRTDPRVIKMYPDFKKRNMVIFNQFFYGLVKRD
ncbi:TetR/AcrR family transcriptional regulator [Bacillus spongiae]|uniref:TetR/AcrR family transcriptional regulator n=1 Tax=Bacillus spongiae TaxID=2683610 RepID=A0ABU8HEE1_9BACI